MDMIESTKEFFSSIESKDWERFDAVTDEEFKFWGPFSFPLDKANYLAMQKVAQEAFPDWAYHLSAMRQEGNCVIATVNISGTHTGMLSLPIPGFESVPPSHIRFELPAEEAVITFREEKVLEINVENAFHEGFVAILRRLGIG